MSELKTIVLDSLKQMQEESSQNFALLSRQMKILETRQTELEKQLERLSELYKILPPLIETINSAARSRPS
jgi:cell division protein FtsB